MSHRHRPASSSTRPFFGPVSLRENRAAHGNVTIVDRCRCGCVRSTNVNGNHVERGAWVSA